MDLVRQVPKALLDGVKAGEGTEHGKVGRPDMGGDEFGLWAGLQGQLQQIPAVQPQNGAAVRVDVADGLQPDGQFFRRFQAGEEDQVVHLRVRRGACRCS